METVSDQRGQFVEPLGVLQRGRLSMETVSAAGQIIGIMENG